MLHIKKFRRNKDMTREKMTIHKALAELKNMDARIKGAINNVTYCIANKHQWCDPR